MRPVFAWCAADDYDEYDKEFDKIREESLKEREKQAKGEINRTKQRLLDLKSKQGYAKAQARTHCSLLAARRLD